MPPSSEVLIALRAGMASASASAFTRDGSELAHARVGHARVAQGGPGSGERPAHDPTAAWQAARLALRGLADRVPDLARRATALALTGADEGLVVVDEDGDPLVAHGPPVASSGSTRSRGIEFAALAGASAERPGRGAGAEQALSACPPDLLDRAAQLLSPADWIGFCLTGRARTNPISAALGPLGRLGCDGEAGEETVRLLAPVVTEDEELGLGRAAAAACRLREGLPVALAPPEPVAAALALGLLDLEADVAFALLEDQASYLVAERRAEPAPSSEGGFALPLVPGAGRLRGAVAAGEPFEWLLDVLEEVVAEIGLIGTGRDELRALLLRRAAAARPARLALHQGAPAPAHGRFEGVARGSDLGDLARALLETAGFAAREALSRLARSPREVRLAGGFASQPAVRTILAACLDAPVRHSLRTDAAIAGAALFAARALGREGSPDAASATWVERFLSESEAPDPALVEIYADAGEGGSGAGQASPRGIASPVMDAAARAVPR